MLPVPDKIKEEMLVACLEEYEAKRAAEETELDTSESSSGSDKENDLPEWAVTEPSSPVRECECEACSCEACEGCSQIKLNAEEK